MDEHPVTTNPEGSLHDVLWRSTQPVGIALVALSAVVFVLTFPFRLSHHVLVPSLVPVFGVAFAVIYASAQLSLVLIMKTNKGAALVCASILAGMGLAWIGMNTSWGYSDVDVPGFSAARHVLCGGAVVSGFVLGLAFLKGWLHQPQ